MTNDFSPLLLTSLVLAALALAIPLRVKPLLVRPGDTNAAIKVSALVALFWGVLILFAFTRFKRRAL